MGRRKRSKFKSPNESEFWVTNVSKRNVTLGDLALSIPKGRSYNLLDSNNFNYTEEQLIKSATEGSLWTKRNFIKMGIQSREIPQDEGPTVSQQPIQVRKASAVVLEEPEYADWLYSDEEFAHEMSEDPE
jgi:hypothetical protein